MTKAEALIWIAEIFEEPAENVRPDTPREEIAGWDSLGVLTLMASLDEKFDIHLNETEIGGMASVGDILGILERNDALSGD